MQNATHSGSSRLRRSTGTEVKPHDSVWGTDVPDDHKLWTTFQKVLFSALPSVGLGKVMLMSETQAYRFSLFANASIRAWEANNQEMEAMRIMVLQNRMVLDLWAAAQGGVCVLLNQTCCTWVPQNSGNGHEIDEALQEMKKVAEAQNTDFVNANTPGWLSWLSGGGWTAIIWKIGLFLLCVMLLFGILTCCVIPCFRIMVQRLIKQTSFTFNGQYALVPLEEIKPDNVQRE